MQINIAGRHVEITEGIRQSVNTKFAKVQSHFPQLDALSVILTVEKHEQKVEANTHFLGTTVSVHSTNEQLYSAIADSAKKLEAALSHRKGTVKANLHEKPPIAEEEE
ncbi:ribosome hibernation-promoting factor, HPF/YfiA family [Teredinibacter purpureus]|uniref:ribosome hibernation-promoting factor, HPF/YfiA family n=1 Tax=Teredinibacter purpureus TaxID=2731756 RepID=UPI0005F845CE|nr:ribosome-associated translation inhibitor RaiA [Teredinibacter purpureus]